MSKVITPRARLSYPHLFEPQTPPGSSTPVYSCALVFEPGSDLSALRAAADEAGKEHWGAKWAEMVKTGKARLPFREDGVDKGYEQGSVFLNVKSQQRPGVVSIYAGPDGRPQPIENAADVYAGCYVRASLRPFPYDKNGNKGVSFALGNLQKIGDGERLDGRARAQDEFEAEAGESLDDL